MKSIKVSITSIALLFAICICAGNKHITLVLYASQQNHSDFTTETKEELQWIEGSVIEGALIFYRTLESGLSGDDILNL